MEPQKLRTPGILALSLLAALCACGPSAADLPTYNSVPDFTLLDQTGEEFHSASHLSGHIWVADFIFTTCTGPCPRMSARMRRLEQDLADLPDVRFVSFTVDPDNDTPPVLAEYAKRYQAPAGRWFFLTGAREALHNLNRNAFLLGDVKGELDHSTRFVLVDAAGVVRGYYISAETEAIDRLQSHLRLLAKESS
jgi:protein SCO1